MRKLKTINLAVGYGREKLIDEINIDINEGEILTFIGPNGAGKTTILKSIAGQLKRMGGNVFVDDFDIQELSGKQLATKMSFVSTDAIHSDMLTCFDIVSQGRYPYTGRFGGLSEMDRDKVNEALKMVNAYDIKDKDYKKISDGQKQKIKLAMAICQEPEIILLDEPTSFLDIKHKVEILWILKEMAERGISVVMSLHELELVRLVADKVVCVDDGRVIKYGVCEDVFKDDFINKLYKVEKGKFDEKLGTVFMKKNSGQPEVFVIAGNGSGAEVYQRLVKKGIPFATGILQENDIDAHMAKNLTDYVICAKAFDDIKDEEYEKALKIMKGCRKVIVCLKKFGKYNEKNRQLIAEAEKMGLEN